MSQRRYTVMTNIISFESNITSNKFIASYIHKWEKEDPVVKHPDLCDESSRLATRQKPETRVRRAQAQRRQRVPVQQLCKWGERWKFDGPITHVVPWSHCSVLMAGSFGVINGHGGRPPARGYLPQLKGPSIHFPYIVMKSCKRP